MTLQDLYEEYLENSFTKKIVLFGASGMAERCLDRHLIGKEIYFISDNNKNKWNTEFMGVNVFPPSKITEENDDIVVIITSIYLYEIKRQLTEMGIKYVYPYTVLNCARLHSYPILSDYFEPCPCDQGGTEAFRIISSNLDKIGKVKSYLCDDESKYIYDMYVKKMKYNYYDYTDVFDPVNLQYFVDGIFEYSEDEVFVDVGVYDGMTSVQFAYECNFKFKMIYGFEPDEISYDRSIKTFSKYDFPNDRYHLIKKGLSDKTEKSMFSQTGTMGSCVSIEGDIEIELVRLDDIINDKVTFIKMDIEGAEIQALKGAENTIKTYKPKLALSIYHRIEDLWEIALLVKKYVPEYKLYVRHHYCDGSEKVLYATL